MTDALTGVERRLLDELLEYHATRSRSELTLPASNVDMSRFRQSLRRSHRAQNLVVCAVIVAIGVLLVVRVIGAATGPALADTPPPLHYTPAGPGAPSARALLLRLAATAATQPAPKLINAGEYAYVKTVGWYLTLGQGAGSVFPQTTQSWLRPNGSGRVVNTTGSGAARRVNDMRVGSGPRLFKPSTNLAVLARQLAVGHPRSDGPQERLVAFTDTASQQPITSAAEAAILRLIARTPNLVNLGTVTDRAGRPGVAVSLRAPQLGNAYTLIFSPRTGQLLGFEQTAIGNTQHRHVRPGAVVAYTTIINAGYTTSTTQTPPRTPFGSATRLRRNRKSRPVAGGRIPLQALLGFRPTCWARSSVPCRTGRQALYRHASPATGHPQRRPVYMPAAERWARLTTNSADHSRDATAPGVPDHEEPQMFQVGVPANLCRRRGSGVSEDRRARPKTQPQLGHARRCDASDPIRVISTVTLVRSVNEQRVRW